jgi:hypothetical protein
MIDGIARLSIYAILSIKIEKTERHAAQAPGLRKQYHKSSFVNIQFPDKSGSPLRCDRLSLSGLGLWASRTYYSLTLTSGRSKV